MTMASRSKYVWQYTSRFSKEQPKRPAPYKAVKVSNYRFLQNLFKVSIKFIPQSRSLRYHKCKEKTHKNNNDGTRHIRCKMAVFIIGISLPAMRGRRPTQYTERHGNTP